MTDPTHTPDRITDAGLDRIASLVPHGGTWAVGTKAEVLGVHPAATVRPERPVVFDLSADDDAYAETDSADNATAIATALNAVPALVAEVRYLRTIIADLARVEGINRDGANDCKPIAYDGTCARHGWGGTLEGRPCPWDRALAEIGHGGLLLTTRGGRRPALPPA